MSKSKRLSDYDDLYSWADANEKEFAELVASVLPTEPPGMTEDELAEVLHERWVHLLLKEMEEDGFVKFRPDGRVSLTPAGRLARQASKESGSINEMGGE